MPDKFGWDNNFGNNPARKPHERVFKRYCASRCPCGAAACKSWHVEPVAALQGVSFTQAQAEAVAALLNRMETTGPEALEAFESARLGRAP